MKQKTQRGEAGKNLRFMPPETACLLWGWEWQCPEARPDELIKGREIERTLEELVPSCVSRLGRWQPAKDPDSSLAEAGSARLIGQLSISPMTPAACPTHMPAGCTAFYINSRHRPALHRSPLPSQAELGHAYPNCVCDLLCRLSSSRHSSTTETTGEAPVRGRRLGSVDGPFYLFSHHTHYLARGSAGSSPARPGYP